MLIVLFTIFFCVIYAFLWVATKKFHKMEESGFIIVYYFIKNFGNIEYYKNPAKHIEFQYHTSCNRISKSSKAFFLSNRQRKIIHNLMSFYTDAISFTEDISMFFHEKHYFSHSEYVGFEKRALELEKKVHTISNQRFVKFIHTVYKDEEISLDFNHKVLESLRNIHNEEFVENELRDNKDFFDKLMKYPLDFQQRESIVKLEDNCLVISSAGSGKTSTAIAKVKYLLEKQHINKEEILVLSYNRKTAEEFKERLNIPDLSCTTFHSLACKIIGEVKGRKPDICEQNLLLRCHYNLINKNKEYQKALNEFVTKHSSLIRSEHDYNRAEEYYTDRAKYGILSPYTDKDGSPIYTKSEEERKICVWLTEHGVRFRYEQSYPINTADKYHRQYKPDFTIYYFINGVEYCLFLEHFAIDSNGNVPKWFGEGKEGGYPRAQQKYIEGIFWKRNVHRENRTILLETTSAMFHDGSIFPKLEQQLKNVGIPIREMTEDEKYAMLFPRDGAMEHSIENLFSSFINLMKSNQKYFDSIMEDIIKSNQGNIFNERCRFLMFEILKPLYDEYEGTLQACHQMDFTDIITEATNLCESEKWNIPYAYILVDEFQDISIDRYKFVLSLRCRNPLTKTYCVGDDWQSIYRFAGSDINLFRNFEEYFGYTEKCKIETTYRFGNPLAEISSAFILKNPSQVQKTVLPSSQNFETNISFISYDSNTKEDHINKIQDILNKIPSDQTILLLARYNYDIKVFKKSCYKNIPNSERAIVTFAGRTMQFMSIHAAKGLEADNVIILNCSQDGGGFPSRVADDPILGFVLCETDTFEYSEERRLFYVALTRAKKHTYVLYNATAPSVFVTEMMQNSTPQMICPQCKRGILKIIKEGESIKDFYSFYRGYKCSNSIAGCDFYWPVDFNTEKEIQQKYLDICPPKQ